MAHVALLFVETQLKPSSTATWEQYHHYYDKELVPSVFKLPIPNKPKTIARYKNVSAMPNYPYAALYPLADLQLLYGPIHDRVMAMARDRPTEAFDGDKAPQHIDFHNTSYRYLYTLENENVPAAERNSDALPLTLVCDSFNAPTDSSTSTKEEALFKARYQVPWRFQVCDDYSRSVVYKLLKGDAPRYFVLHHFDSEPGKLGPDVLAAGSGECVNRQVYSLILAMGTMVYPSAERQDSQVTSLGLPKNCRSSSERRRSSSPLAMKTM